MSGEFQSTERSSKPGVSVIIPVYNSEKYLRECLDSVVDQTLREIEIICVDDGSTDGSPEILREYRERDARISVFTQSNQGAGVARNYGIEHAAGKYLAFLDSDDIMLPEALELLYQHAEETEADVALCSAYSFQTDRKSAIEFNGTLTTKYLPDEEPFNKTTHGKYLFQTSAGQPWGKLFSKSFILKNKLRFPNFGYSEDMPFVYLAYSLAGRIAVVEKRLFLYRKIDGSGSLEDTKDSVPLASVESSRYLWKKLEELGLCDELRQTFVNTLLDRMAFNLRSLKTRSAFNRLYECVKNEVVPEFGLDSCGEAYFYNDRNYRFIRELVESDSSEDFLFAQTRELQSQVKEKNQKIQDKSHQLRDKKRQLRDKNQQLRDKDQRLRDRNRQLRDKDRELRDVRKEMNAIRASRSYRIGRCITWLPRKLHGLLRKLTS